MRLHRAGHTGALRLALIYGAVAGGYIIASTGWVSSVAEDPGHMSRVELAKGLGFVGVTGLLLYGLARHWFGRIHAQAAVLLERQYELMRAERRAIAWVFAHAFSRSLRNEFVVIGASAEALLHGDAPQEVVPGLLRAAHSAERLLARMEALAPGDADGGASAFDLVQVVEDILALAKALPAARGRTIEWRHPAQPVPLAGDATALRHLVADLVLNALVHGQPGGRVAVRLEPAATAGWVALQVEDDGPGFTAELLAEPFVAFRSTVAGASGLGLVSVQDTAARHGGTATLGVSAALGGAAVVITLPGRQARRAGTDARQPAPTAGGDAAQAPSRAVTMRAVTASGAPTPSTRRSSPLAS